MRVTRLAKRETIWNDEAERAALGAAMLGAKGLRPVVLRLTPGDFFNPAHASIFEVIAELNRKRQKVDLQTVRNLLGERDQLRKVGGQDYLVACAESAVSIHQAADYADIVKQDAQCRRMLAACEMASSELQGRENLAEAQAILREATRPIGAGGLVSAGAIDLTSKVKGFESSISLVNDKTDCKGWPAGQTSIIGAYPGGGKTTLLLQDFAHAASLNERVVYATFGDLSGKELMRKVMRQLTGWSAPPRQSELYTADQWQKVLGDWQVAYDAEIYEARTVQGGLGRKVGTFCDEMRAHSDKGAVQRIYVDYAQKVHPDRHSGNQVDDLQRISDELKALSEELDCAVIIGTQLTQTVEGPQPKGCRAVFEDCAVAAYVFWHNGNDPKTHEPTWALARPDDGEDRVLVKLAKDRVGMLGRREYGWCDKHTTFVEAGN